MTSCRVGECEGERGEGEMSGRGKKKNRDAFSICSFRGWSTTLLIQHFARTVSTRLLLDVTRSYEGAARERIRIWL